MVPTSARASIYIRVRQDKLLPIPTSTDASPPDSLTPASPPGLVHHRHLYLIEGTFTDISRYAGTTVDWIIKVAHLICDPLRAGRVFTPTTGTSADWYASDRAASWQQVFNGDRLLPGIYEFEPAGTIMLSKISERHNHSLTTVGSESSSTTFRRKITERDAGCVVTRSPDSLVASHLVPKRMGSEGAREVVTRFVGTEEAIGIHRYNARIGILLMSTLDGLVDHYQLGFYRATVSQKIMVLIILVALSCPHGLE